MFTPGSAFCWRRGFRAFVHHAEEFYQRSVLRQSGGKGCRPAYQILLFLLIIELLYTVQVSFREHGLLVEPFLVVALIAVIRRILVLTAELPKLQQAAAPGLNHALLELSLLTIMVVVLVAALIVLQKQAKQSNHHQETRDT